jgi:hypothetical protein
MSHLEKFAEAYLMDATGEGKYESCPGSDVREDKIKSLYLAAIEAEPNNVIYRYHYINYLDTRSSITEEFEQINQLLPLLTNKIPFHIDLIASVFDKLITESERALPLFDKLPIELQQETKIKWIKEKLQTYQMVMRDSESFYPSIFESSAWWERGPLLLPTQGLEDWTPGRITYVDDKEVTIVSARHEDDGTHMYLLTFDKNEFLSKVNNNIDCDNLVDTFVEIGVYNGELKIWAFPFQNRAMSYHPSFPSDLRFLQTWKCDPEDK